AECRRRGRDRAGRDTPEGVAARLTGWRVAGSEGEWGGGRGGGLCILMAGRDFLSLPRPLAFAPRGRAAPHPENSWPAFDHPVGPGYTYLEPDLQATADGVLVAFHDRSLDRVTDRAGRIAQLPYREVSAARIGGTDAIPTLEDLLGAWPEARFNLDVKDD